MQPVIYVGLGGNGTTIIEGVFRRVLARLKAEGREPESIIGRKLHFISVDTRPKRDLSNKYRAGSAYFAFTGFDGDKLVKNYLTTDPALFGTWWPKTNDIRNPKSKMHYKPGYIDYGAGMTRCNGRLALKHHIDDGGELLSAISSACSKAKQDGADVPPIVLLCHSLSGGTGSGLAIDLAYMIRQQLGANENSSINIEIAVGPDVVAKLVKPDAHGKIFANGYAILKELEFWQNDIVRKSSYSHPIGATTVQLNQEVRPFDVSFLFSCESQGFSVTPEKLYDVISDAIYALTTSEQVLGPFDNTKKHCREHRIWRNPLTREARATSFAAMGYAALVYPRDQVTKIITDKIVKAYFQNNFLAKLPDDTIGKQLDSFQDRKSLKADHLLNQVREQIQQTVHADAGLRDEFARIVDGMVDSTTVDAGCAKLKAKYQDFEQKLSKACGDQKKKKALVTAITASMDEECESILSGVVAEGDGIDKHPFIVLDMFLDRLRITLEGIKSRASEEENACRKGKSEGGGNELEGVESLASNTLEDKSSKGVCYVRELKKCLKGFWVKKSAQNNLKTKLEELWKRRRELSEWSLLATIMDSLIQHVRVKDQVVEFVRDEVVKERIVDAIIKDQASQLVSNLQKDEDGMIISETVDVDSDLINGKIEALNRDEEKQKSLQNRISDAMQGPLKQSLRKGWKECLEKGAELKSLRITRDDLAKEFRTAAAQEPAALVGSEMVPSIWEALWAEASRHGRCDSRDKYNTYLQKRILQLKKRAMPYLKLQETKLTAYRGMPGENLQTRDNDAWFCSLEAFNGFVAPQLGYDNQTGTEESNFKQLLGLAGGEQQAAIADVGKDTATIGYVYIRAGFPLEVLAGAGVWKNNYLKIAKGGMTPLHVDERHVDPFVDPNAGGKYLLWDLEYSASASQLHFMLMEHLGYIICGETGNVDPLGTGHYKLFRENNSDGTPKGRHRIGSQGRNHAMDDFPKDNDWSEIVNRAIEFWNTELLQKDQEKRLAQIREELVARAKTANGEHLINLEQCQRLIENKLNARDYGF